MTVSSIFSSKRWTPVRTVVLSVLLGLGIILALEVWIRALGAVPSFDNSIPRWALVRSELEADGSEQAVALLGASRVQAGLSHDALREALPGAQIHNLSFAGRAPYLTLEDLADNSDFRGLVILSFLPIWLLPDQGRDAQIELVQYYRNYWNSARALETRMGNFINRYMALRSGNYGFGRLLRNLGRFGKPVDQPPNARIGEDRQQYLTLRESEITRRRAQEWAVNMVQIAGGVLEDVDWKHAYAELAEKVAKIQERGGQVVFVRMPSTGLVNEIESELLPRADYWDRMVASVPGALGLHFEDIPGVEAIELPDYSHLDVAGRDEFTALMAAEIARMLRENGSTRFDFADQN
ncbi:hypothetical protein [Ruegeria sp.]|uniref:hypothetical protein n=1 Tax=Ruegeria sp. TaxID=1879320 RepID=UPI002326FD67|nr:hypothetical protein [Ruegeria sp.]MDA7964160.1 hypothetical protein [Ruegeria sp.]